MEERAAGGGEDCLINDGKVWSKLKNFWRLSAAAADALS